MKEKDNIYRERFRLIEMNEMLGRISAVCFGRDKSIMPVITDKRGKLSDVKLKGFVKELLKCYEEYKKILCGEEISDEERRFAESAIFISVIVAGTGYGDLPNDGDYKWKPFSRKVTFEDIRLLLSESFPRKSEDRYSAEERRGKFDFVGEDLFYYINRILPVLREKIVAEPAEEKNSAGELTVEPAEEMGSAGEMNEKPAEEKNGAGELTAEQAARKNVTDKSSEDQKAGSEEKKDQGDCKAGSDEEHRTAIRLLRDDRMLAELDEEAEDFMENREIYEKMEREMLESSGYAQTPEWIIQKQMEEMLRLENHFRDVFPMKENFVGACRTYRQLVFKVCPENIDRIFEYAVNLYLVRNGISPLADQNEFRNIHAEIAVAERRIARKVSGKGGRDRWA